MNFNSLTFKKIRDIIQLIKCYGGKYMYEEKEVKPKKEKKEKVKVPKTSVKKTTENVELENTEKKKKFVLKADWVSICVKLLIFLVISFLIIFVYTKIKQGNGEEVDAKNLEAIKSAAYTYFKDANNRPSVENEEVQITLKDMEDTKLITELKDSKKNVCSKAHSYVSLIKKNSTKYDLEVYLSCGGVSKDANYTFTYSTKNETSGSNEKVVLYELERVVASSSYVCPEGYVLSGTNCYSNKVTLSTNGIPKYKVTPASDTAARYKKEKNDYEFVDPIETKTTVALSCSTGYDLVGEVCQKNGDVKSRLDTSYYCSQGTLKGSKCLLTTEPISGGKSYYCSKGKIINDECYITTDVNYRCTKGKMDSDIDGCYTSYKATTGYSDWKLHSLVTSTLKPSNTTTVMYEVYKTDGKKVTYKKYTRFKEYYCNGSDVYKGGVCRHYSYSYRKTTCPSGYAVASNGKECYKYEKAVVKSSSPSKCPSGYTKYSDECRKYVDAIKKYDTKYYCSYGYDLTSDRQCIKTKAPDVNEEKVTYSCPDGYEIKGSGKLTKCYKKTTEAGYYYCSNSKATLVNNRCVIASKTTFLGYKCPSGYELSGNMCYKFVGGEKKSAAKSNNTGSQKEVIYSKNKEVSGFKWTGKTKEI